MERIFDAFRRTADVFRRFRRAEDGGYVVYVGLAAIPMVAFAGLGVDISRAYLAEARLQSAIDAAAIAMGSADGPTAEIEELGRTYFYANFPANTWSQPTELEIEVTRLVPGDETTRPESFSISAKARVDSLFFTLLPAVGGGEAAATGHYDSITVGAASKALTEIRGLEVVLVLDVTGSMFSGGNLGGLRIEAMRDATLEMVKILFGDQHEPELLKVGVVPYNTVVNIGRNMHSYVTDTGLDASGNVTTPNPFGQTEWFGCVQARPGGHDLTDEYDPTASDGSGKWYAYRWPIEGDRHVDDPYDTTGVCRNEADFSTGDYRFYQDPLTIFEETRSDTWDVYNDADPPVLVDSGETERVYDRGSDGPNKGCPGEVLPLTNSVKDVWNYLQEVTVMDRAGTITATGMTWGWRLISPGEPFTEGRPYDDRDWDKVIIVLTDGQQQLSSQHRDCDDSQYVTSPTSLQPPLYKQWRFNPNDYGMDGYVIGQGGTSSGRREGPDYQWSAYGYVHPNDSATLGFNDINTTLETRFGQVCDAIKAVVDPNTGGSAIQIFAITFGTDINDGDSVSDMMKDCTNDPLNNYYHAPNTAELKSAFQEIAEQLTALRLTD